MDHAAGARPCQRCGFAHAPIATGLHRVRDTLGVTGAIQIEPDDDRPSWLRRGTAKALSATQENR